MDETEDEMERVEWMAPVHYEILGFYDEHDIWLSPRDLGLNIDYGQNYVSSSCKDLLRAGLLEQEGQLYRLSDRGRAFLRGEVDPDDLADPT